MLPELITDHAWHGTAYMNNEIYISGGELEWRISSKTEKYTCGHWVSISPMTTPRYNHTLSVYRKHIYAFGGSNNSGNLYMNSVERYDGQMWSPVNMTLPSGRNYSSVLQVKNDLLLVGGYSFQGEVREVWRWRKKREKWVYLCPCTTEYTLSNAVAMRYGVLYAYNQSPSRDSLPLTLPSTP